MAYLSSDKIFLYQINKNQTDQRKNKVQTMVIINDDFTLKKRLDQMCKILYDYRTKACQKTH